MLPAVQYECGDPFILCSEAALAYFIRVQRGVPNSIVKHC